MPAVEPVALAPERTEWCYVRASVFKSFLSSPTGAPADSDSQNSGHCCSTPGPSSSLQLSPRQIWVAPSSYFGFRWVKETSKSSCLIFTFPDFSVHLKIVTFLLLLGMFLYLVFSYKCWQLPDHKSGPISLPEGTVKQHVFANVAVSHKSMELKNTQDYYMWLPQKSPGLNAFEILTDLLSHACEGHGPGLDLKIFL